MEEKGSSMTDTAPLVKLKNAMQKLQLEIGQFDVRVGVLEHTLLTARLRAKKNHLLQPMRA